jgi:hypothetical protein
MYLFFFGNGSTFQCILSSLHKFPDYIRMNCFQLGLKPFLFHAHTRCNSPMLIFGPGYAALSAP